MKKGGNGVEEIEQLKKQIAEHHEYIESFKKQLVQMHQFAEAINKVLFAQAHIIAELREKIEGQKPSGMVGPNGEKLN